MKTFVIFLGVVIFVAGASDKGHRDSEIATTVSLDSEESDVKEEASTILRKLDHDLATCDGVDIREIGIDRVELLFRENRLSSRNLTKCYLHRISAMNPYLKAVIEVNPDAVEIAERADEERARGEVRGSLHGIPILVKDNYDTDDKMESTAGSLALLGVKPLRDAEVVRKLREAGVVILGKANLGELSFFRGTNIPNGWSGRGGQTHSAYNLRTNPQGSSSGSAVGTSANLAVAAIGTETDGSLISPASVAACVSMKSTLGIASSRGIIPISRHQDTAGPITRTVLDTAHMLDGMVSEHRSDLKDCGGSYATCLKKHTSKVFKIAVPRTPFWVPELANSTLLNEELPVLNRMLKNISTDPRIELSDPVYENWEEIKNISDTEVIVVLHDFKHDFNEYLTHQTIAGQNKTKIKSLVDVIKFNSEHPTPQAYNQTLLEQAQATDGITNATYLLALKSNKENAKKYLDGFFDKGFDAIVVPSEPRYNTTVDPTLGNSPFVAWTVAAVAGYPSITIPVDRDANGVPFGVCFIGRPYSELALLKIAKHIEGLWPGRRPPRFLNELQLVEK